MSQKLITKLIAEATGILYEKKYSNRRIEYISSVWKQFDFFCKKGNQKYYTSKLHHDFVSEIENSNLKTATIKTKITAMKILSTVASDSTWDKGHLNSMPNLCREYMEYLQEQDNLLAKYGRSESTRRTMYKSTYRMLRFFQKGGITNFTDFTQNAISSLVLSLKGHARSTLRGELSRMRIFLSYLYLLEHTDRDLSMFVPRYNLGHAQSLVKIWNSEELKKVLKVIDPSSPKGKRDIAIITIATELGVRSKDICNLRLTDIDWEMCSISFIQSKTGKPNVLPLNEKIGNAIINYLKVRPKTASKYIFVNFNPPYEKLEKFSSSFIRYVQRSGVKIPKDAHHGLHSLRATVATRLLDASVSPDTIFSFLGHSDRSSLNSYIRLDIENLRECALTFKDGELI